MRACMLSCYAKSLQSCPTLCDPIDSSPPGSPVPGILQARILEWVAISISNAWKWKVKVKSLSRVWLLATSWTAAFQGPLSMGFSRQEYWSGVPLPSPEEGTIIPIKQMRKWRCREMVSDGTRILSLPTTNCTCYFTSWTIQRHNSLLTMRKMRFREIKLKNVHKATWL